MAQVSVKKFFAHVSHLSVSPSPVSRLTHLLLSSYDDSLSLDFPVHTFLPYLPVLKAQGMRISERGQEVWLSGQVRPKHRSWPKKFDKSTSEDSDTMLVHDPDLNEISDLSKNTHENIGLFGVLSMFELSVTAVSHEDFCSSWRK